MGLSTFWYSPGSLSGYDAGVVIRVRFPSVPRICHRYTLHTVSIAHSIYLSERDVKPGPWLQTWLKNSSRNSKLIQIAPGRLLNSFVNSMFVQFYIILSVELSQYLFFTYVKNYLKISECIPVLVNIQDFYKVLQWKWCYCQYICDVNHMELLLHHVTSINQSEIFHICN